MAGNGELLISVLPPNPLLPIFVGFAWNGPGSPAPIAVAVPSDLSLIGQTFYAQGLLFDPSSAFGIKFGLTDAVELFVGP